MEHPDFFNLGYRQDWKPGERLSAAICVVVLAGALALIWWAVGHLSL